MRIDPGSVSTGFRSLATLLRREVSLVLSLLVIAGGIWGFLEIADEVREGESQTFDTALLLALRDAGDNRDPLGPPWIMQAAQDITALGGLTVLTLMTLGVIFYLIMARARGAALLVAVSVTGGVVLSHLLKLGFDRPRPDLVPHEVTVHTLSFPSGHAMLSAVTYLTLGVLLTRVMPRRRLKIYVLSLAVLLTLLIGASRVYLGVHWPTDVLAGWCLGAAWALMCWLVALWLQRRGKVGGAQDDTP